MYTFRDDLWCPRPGPIPSSYTGLTAEQERDLGWKIINDQCTASRQRLQHEHRHLVDAIVGKYAGHALPLAVLFEAGNAGLILAVDDFDPAKGLRFSTRAGWWIRQAIRQAVLNATQQPLQDLIDTRASAIAVRSARPKDSV